MSTSSHISHDSTLSPRRMKTAGYMALFNALLTIPWFLFTYSLTDRHDSSLRMAEASMLVGGLALEVYLLLSFQQLLHRRYAFHQADKTISILIQASIIQTAANILGLVVPELSHAVGMFSVIMVVILGILHMMFGIWLLLLASPLGGMHRSYCYLNIMTGFAFGTIVLLPVGILSGAIADVMLGTIFLQAAAPTPGREVLSPD